MYISGKKSLCDERKRKPPTHRISQIQEQRNSSILFPSQGCSFGAWNTQMMWQLTTALTVAQPHLASA
jgi:hypothetical protein